MIKEASGFWLRWKIGVSYVMIPPTTFALLQIVHAAKTAKDGKEDDYNVDTKKKGMMPKKSGSML